MGSEPFPFIAQKMFKCVRGDLYWREPFGQDSGSLPIQIEEQQKLLRRFCLQAHGAIVLKRVSCTVSDPIGKRGAGFFGGGQPRKGYAGPSRCRQLKGGLRVVGCPIQAAPTAAPTVIRCLHPALKRFWQESRKRCEILLRDGLVPRQASLPTQVKNKRIVAIVRKTEPAHHAPASGKYMSALDPECSGPRCFDRAPWQGLQRAPADGKPLLVFKTQFASSQRFHKSVKKRIGT